MLWQASQYCSPADRTGARYLQELGLLQSTPGASPCLKYFPAEFPPLWISSFHFKSSINRQCLRIPQSCNPTRKWQHPARSCTDFETQSHHQHLASLAQAHISHNVCVHEFHQPQMEPSFSPMMVAPVLDVFIPPLHRYFPNNKCNQYLHLTRACNSKMI